MCCTRKTAWLPERACAARGAPRAAAGAVASAAVHPGRHDLTFGSGRIGPRLWPIGPIVIATVSCSGHGSGPAVRAPVSASWPAGGGGGGGGVPAACGNAWSLDVIGGDGRVVVACAHDVQRRSLDPTSAIARALSPALDPARERVCACAGRMRAPPFVDLVFTARPEDGQVTVRPSDAEAEDADPELGPAFAACIGTVVTTFDPLASGACPDAEKASVLYPVRLELEP